MIYFISLRVLHVPSLPDMSGLKLLLSSHGMIYFSLLQNQHKQIKSLHCKQVQSYQGRFSTVCSGNLLCRGEIRKYIQVCYSFKRWHCIPFNLVAGSDTFSVSCAIAWGSRILHQRNFKLQYHKR